MGFLVQCDNKGCNKQQEPLLNVETNQAICSLCDNPITNITSFAKTQLKAMGQILRTKVSDKPFAFKCEGCKRKDVPEIKENKAFCVHCHAQLNVTSFFINSMKK